MISIDANLTRHQTRISKTSPSDDLEPASLIGQMANNTALRACLSPADLAKPGPRARFRVIFYSSIPTRAGLLLGRGGG